MGAILGGDVVPRTRGSTAVDSLPDRGTTFAIDIPADARPSQAVPDQSLGLKGRAPCGGCGYFRCLLTSLVISNMLTGFFPPKTAASFSSGLIILLFFWSWSPC